MFKAHSILVFVAAMSALKISAAEAVANGDVEDAKSVISKITDVTVYADRAQVTRRTSVDLPSEAVRFAFAQLPGWIDEGSVRVSVVPAEAGQVLDVQIRRTYLARTGDQEAQKAEAAVQDLTDQIAALDDEKGVLDAQAKQVEAIRVFALDKLPKDVATREIKPEEYGQSVQFIASSLREIAKSKRELEKKRRDLQPELNARQRKLDELRQRAQLEQRTVIVTAKGTGQAATLALSYMLPGATWEPIHELRAATDAEVVRLSSLAVVMQTTGEDWSDVALALSTQKSTETMKIPELEALLLSGRKLPRFLTSGTDSFQEASRSWAAQNASWFELNNRDTAVQQAFRRNQMAQIENAKRVERVFETVQQRGTTAHFQALSRQTVRSDGRSVRVPIGNVELAAQHRILAAPETSLNAARIVELVNPTQQPLLPGRVSLFLTGAFLGLTETEFVGPGEGFALYLGVADHVKLTRTLDKKRSALTRSGSKTRMQVSFLDVVENLAGQGSLLQFTDRVPVSETDEVRVSGIKIQPEGKPDPKGLLRWDVNLAAKQTKEFRIEYTLEYPNDLTRRAGELKSAPGAAPPSSGVAPLYDQIRTLERRF